MMAANKLQLTASSDLEIVFTRSFDAPRELVWRAFTESELVKRWLTGPPGHRMPVCEIDFRIGGPWRYVWDIGDGKEMGAGGVYREIVAPERIVHTELFDEDWTGGETLVTTLFAEQDGRTLVTMTIRYSSKETRDAVLKSSMEEGVAQSYDNLDELLANI